MKCVRKEEGREILQEIHEGVCRNHAASRTLVSKAFRSCFYWLTALADTEALVCRCTNFQFFSKQPHVPPHNLITIPPSWSFACWGLDMIGPLTAAPGGFTHVLVAICCRLKPTGEQRQATRGAGRLPGLLVGPSPSVNGPAIWRTPWLGVARRAT
jgi:hypothetical protein